MFYATSMYFIYQKSDFIMNQIQKFMKHQMKDNGFYILTIKECQSYKKLQYSLFRMMQNLAYHGDYKHHLILHALNWAFVQVLAYSCHQLQYR